MRQRKIKKLRKEATEYIQEKKLKFLPANYSIQASNPYQNFIRKWKKDV